MLTRVRCPRSFVGPIVCWPCLTAAILREFKALFFLPAFIPPKMVARLSRSTPCPLRKMFLFPFPASPPLCFMTLDSSVSHSSILSYRRHFFSSKPRSPFLFLCVLPAPLILPSRMPRPSKTTANAKSKPTPAKKPVSTPPPKPIAAKAAVSKPVGSSEAVRRLPKPAAAKEQQVSKDIQRLVTAGLSKTAVQAIGRQDLV